MRHLLAIGALMALLSLPASAQTGTTPAATSPSPSGMMNCPQFSDTAGMQRDLGSMMSQMQAMMNATANPAMKERMQNMHEHMAAMMVNMQRMGTMGNMAGAGRGMMGGPSSSNAAPATPETTPSPTAPEDHETHHPEQQ